MGIGYSSKASAVHLERAFNTAVAFNQFAAQLAKATSEVLEALSAYGGAPGGQRYDFEAFKAFAIARQPDLAGVLDMLNIYAFEAPANRKCGVLEAALSDPALVVFADIRKRQITDLLLEFTGRPFKVEFREAA